MCPGQDVTHEVPNQLLTTFLCMTNSIDNTLQVATFKHFLPGEFSVVVLRLLAQIDIVVCIEQ